VGADGHDDHVGCGGSPAKVVGEAQATRGDTVGDKLGEPGLVEGDAALTQGRQSTGIGIDTRDVVLPFGKARARDEPNVAQTDYGDTHSLFPPSAEASVLRLVRDDPDLPKE
jgi:hypothetical protein